MSVQWAGASSGGHPDLGRRAGSTVSTVDAVSVPRVTVAVPTVPWPTDRSAVHPQPWHHHPTAPHAFWRGTGEELPARVSGQVVTWRAGPLAGGQATWVALSELSWQLSHLPALGRTAQQGREMDLCIETPWSSGFAKDVTSGWNCLLNHLREVSRSPCQP